jgi:hypothetical protein
MICETIRDSRSFYLWTGTYDSQQDNTSAVLQPHIFLKPRRRYHWRQWNLKLVLIRWILIIIIIKILIIVPPHPHDLPSLFLQLLASNHHVDIKVFVFIFSKYFWKIWIFLKLIFFYFFWRGDVKNNF